ncbi:MAG: nitroreductase family protein [Desulfobacula sp.]|nr:nitroreductase family protein [Desulfobacula sp.]
MEFGELIKKRRSCRGFDKTPVSQKNVDDILEAAQWAPSPLNMQPFQFITITDTTIKAQIQKIGIEAKQTVIDNNGPGWVEKYPMGFVADSPLIIVVVYDPEKGGLGNYFGMPHGALQASCAAVQNMMLKATELGMDSLWFTFFEPAGLRPILDIPDTLDIAGAILVGKPAMATKSPGRKTPRVHKEKFTHQ